MSDIDNERRAASPAANRAETPRPEMTAAWAAGVLALAAEAGFDENSAAWLDGPSAKAPIRRFCIDSREVGPGDAFVAFKGQKADGNDFAPSALKSGAALCLATDPRLAGLEGVLVVQDAVAALAALARRRRADVNPYVVAITGSCGKTTAKNMLARILRRRYGPKGAVATEGNRNNDIGAPLTLLSMGSGARAVAVEMGMNHKGELSRLTRIARPDFAVVLNALRAHIGAFGDVESIARAKSEIYEGLGPDGIAAWRADSPCAGVFRGAIADLGLEGLSFGPEDSGADARFGAVTLGAAECAFDLLFSPRALRLARGRAAWASGDRLEAGAQGGAKLRVRVAAPGGAIPANAAAAALAGLAAGASLADVEAGLADYVPQPGRMMPAPLGGGSILIDDCYNANPDSMALAMDALERFASAPERVFVMGDMGELGGAALALHVETARRLARKAVDRVLFYGPLSAQACELTQDDRAKRAVSGLGPQRAQSFALEDYDRLLDAAKTLRRGGAILVKGSHATGLDRLCRDLARALGGQ